MIILIQDYSKGKQRNGVQDLYLFVRTFFKQCGTKVLKKGHYFWTSRQTMIMHFLCTLDCVCILMAKG